MVELRKAVGSRNVTEVLSLNRIPTTPYVGKALEDAYNTTVSTTATLTHERKIVVLNSVSSDADVFESVSMLDEDGWKYMSAANSLPGMLRMPDTLILPSRPDILGGTSKAISRSIYNKAVGYLKAGLNIDPIIFNKYNSTTRARPVSGTTTAGSSMQWFKIPWGEVTLYSSLSNSSVDFPVYPEEYEDGYVANYDTMPDMLYQYEPWPVYKSSGPRSNDLTFKMHRDMWSGDHRDGKCNELIRFCQANCFPVYNGATVNTATVVLYIAGKPLIRGILTSVKTQYSGPIGLDGFPLYVEMTLNITEVSSEPLNYYSVMMKGLIG
jgi:hypothetical protein